MRDVKVIKVYNLVDSNGNKLQLRLGVLKNLVSETFISDADGGLRWSFVGKRIPMPVRSGYWFNGFAEDTMLDWLRENGWALHTCVWMSDGKANVYELPDAPELSKGNEIPAKAYVPSDVMRRGEATFNNCIRTMCSNGNKLMAVYMYRYVHPCNMKDAVIAVNAILDSQE